MFELIKSALDIAQTSRGDAKNTSWVWIIVAVIIAVAVVAGIYIYVTESPRPFWEISPP